MSKVLHNELDTSGKGYYVQMLQYLYFAAGISMAYKAFYNNHMLALSRSNGDSSSERVSYRGNLN